MLAAVEMARTDSTDEVPVSSCQLAAANKNATRVGGRKAMGASFWSAI